MRRRLAVTVASAALIMLPSAGLAGMEEAEKWIEDEFQPSTLSKDEQMAEMEWFVQAAEPFQGMEINVLSETIPTHSYESETLTKAFEEITGIRVNHQLLGPQHLHLLLPAATTHQLLSQHRRGGDHCGKAREQPEHHPLIDKEHSALQARTRFKKRMPMHTQPTARM